MAFCHSAPTPENAFWISLQCWHKYLSLVIYLPAVKSELVHLCIQDKKLLQFFLYTTLNYVDVWVMLMTTLMPICLFYS